MGRRGELQIFHGEGKVRGEPLYCAGPLLCRLSPFCAPSSQSGSHWNRSGTWGNQPGGTGSSPSCGDAAALPVLDFAASDAAAGSRHVQAADEEEEDEGHPVALGWQVGAGSLTSLSVQRGTRGAHVGLCVHTGLEVLPVCTRV